MKGVTEREDSVYGAWLEVVSGEDLSGACLQ